MICAKYSDDWKGERPYPERSSFTIKGYDLEIKKWEYPTYDLSKAGKFLFTLYKIEHSPEHPAVMGFCSFYENDYFGESNPFFEDEVMRKIYGELYELGLKLQYS